MPNSLGVGVFVKMPADVVGRNAVNFAEKLRDERRVNGCLFLGASQVQLDAVTGAEHHGLGAVPCGEFCQRPGEFRRIECQFLAKFDACRRYVAADCPEVH